jgi:hypothetical protein
LTLSIFHVITILISGYVALDRWHGGGSVREKGKPFHSTPPANPFIPASPHQGRLVGLIYVVTGALSLADPILQPEECRKPMELEGRPDHI